MQRTCEAAERDSFLISIVIAVLAVLALTGCTTRIIVEEKPCSQPALVDMERALQPVPYRVGSCTASIPPICTWQDPPPIPMPSAVPIQIPATGTLKFFSTPDTGVTLQNEMGEWITLWYEGAKVVTP